MGETVYITVVGTFVVTMGRIVIITVRRGCGTVIEVRTGALWGGLSAQGGQTHIKLRELESQSRSREPEASGVDPLLAIAALNGSLPNLVAADGAWEFGGCCANKCGARVRVDIAADK